MTKSPGSHSRRPASILAVLCCASLLLAACGTRANTLEHFAHPSSKRPDIVFVLTDDLSTDLLRYMPHVRALMRRGMTFRRFIVSDSLCCPSRASIFTGDYPHDTGVFTNDAPAGGYAKFNRRGDQRHTFSQALQDVGYRTAFMGKYLNGYEEHASPTAAPRGAGKDIPPGWNEWDGIGGGYRGFGFWVNHDGHPIRYVGTSQRHYLTEVLQRRAERFIRSSARHRDAFMLEVATFAPHYPYVPDPVDRGRLMRVIAPRVPSYDRLPHPTPPWLRHHPPLNPLQQTTTDTAARLRAQSVLSVDRMVGSLEQTLRRTGQLSHTIFVFSSDNGLHLGNYRMMPGKLTAFDTDIRVPLVVAGPGIAPGSMTGQLAQNVDLAPTFEQIAGAKVPADVDGHSLLPLLRGRGGRWRRVALVEHRPGGPLPKSDPDHQVGAGDNPPDYVALRGRNFLFVHYAGGYVEYYDLARDPFELHNLGPTLSRPRRRLLLHWARLMAHCHGGQCWADAARPPGPGS